MCSLESAAGYRRQGERCWERRSTDAADEASISRRYGGIHFVEGDLVSREIGVEVGYNAYKKALKYFNSKGAEDDD